MNSHPPSAWHDIPARARRVVVHGIGVPSLNRDHLCRFLIQFRDGVVDGEPVGSDLKDNPAVDRRLRFQRGRAINARCAASA